MGPGADPGKHCVSVVGLLKQPVYAQLPPAPHHFEGIAAANVYQIRREDRLLQLSPGRSQFEQIQDCGLTSELSTVDPLETFPILHGVVAGGGNKQRLGPSFAGELDNVLIDGQRLCLAHVSATNGDNFTHVSAPLVDD